MAKESTDNSNKPCNVGQVIQQAREAKELTYEQLGELSGCFATSIERIESGEIQGDRDQLDKLAGVLGLDATELFTLAMNAPSDDSGLYSGQDVRKARKAMGLTQQQLASLADCCGRTISSFELGKNRPQRRVFDAIVKILGDYLAQAAPGKVAAKAKTNAKSSAKTKKKAKLAPPAHIGEKIKRAREAKGMSQEQLAEIIGAYPYTIAWIERGKERPTPELEEAIWEAVESDLSKPEPKAHRGDTSHIFTSGKNLLRDLFGDDKPKEDETSESDGLISPPQTASGSKPDLLSMMTATPPDEPAVAEEPQTASIPEPNLAAATNIAQAVKQARANAGLSAQELSRLVPSCSSGLIAYIEVGFKKPTAEIAKALAIALNVDPEEFLKLLN
ncbi:MAG: helix-turn-helix domain-containing protein [Phycisphaerales bacterium]|nr:helix-turn-helix domain-containing protein [Phycisphaerales bacterium]